MLLGSESICSMQNPRIQPVQVITPVPEVSVFCSCRSLVGIMSRSACPPHTTFAVFGVLLCVSLLSTLVAQVKKTRVHRRRVRSAPAPQPVQPYTSPPVHSGGSDSTTNRVPSATPQTGLTGGSAPASSARIHSPGATNSSPRTENKSSAPGTTMYQPRGQRIGLGYAR